MIIKHFVGGVAQDISNLVTHVTWSGNRLQVARKLQFRYIFEPRDANIKPHIVNLGETVQGFTSAADTVPVFQGNIYSIERNTQESEITVTAYDNLFILSKSKTTKKYTDMTAEDVTRAVCTEMGIKAGNLASTGVKMTFIAPEKTGYQIIMMAYTYASKKTGKKYHPVMNVDSLDVVEKGTLIDGFEANMFTNEENSTYRESIEAMVNRIMVTDEQGNFIRYEGNEDWIKKYSMIQNVYKSSPNRNTADEVKAMLKGPERLGTIELLGDYRVKSSYSIKITDLISQLTGQFFVKSDTHEFENGIHTMRLEIEFENMMNEEKGVTADGKNSKG